MTLFLDPKVIIPGDEVFHEYDGKRAFGTVIAIDKELLEVDYSTERSTERKTDKFVQGIWKKEVL